MKYSELNSVFADLKAIPTSFSAIPERKKALLHLDEIFGEADSETTTVLGNFYRKQVDNALTEISSYTGKTPRLWKFYSSGIIIKSDNLTMAIDINDGCVPVQGRTKITLRGDQIRKLATLIDEYYCTHSHVDHLSPALCDALARRNKIIVMPAEAIRRWLIKGAVPAENFHSNHCKTFLNWQGDASGGLDCAMYLFTLSNKRTVMVRGDIYHKEGFDACVAQLHTWKTGVDYAFLTPYFSDGDDPVEVLSKKFNCRFIPIHEWEFGHRVFGQKGPATQCYAELYEKFDYLYQSGRAQILSWGESIALD